jgi:antitoxin CcdA
MRTVHAHAEWRTIMLRFDDSPKRPTNLSLNAKVLEMARELGMNLSQTVDTLLAEEVRKRYFERWNIDNAEAIAHYNARIERDGTLSQRIRKHLAADAEPHR